MIDQRAVLMAIVSATMFVISAVMFAAAAIASAIIHGGCH